MAELDQSNSMYSFFKEVKAALITGASAGIGVVFAEELARLGVQSLVLVARRSERLQSVKEKILQGGYKGRVLTFTCDLRQEAERENLKKVIDEAGLEIDLLINNAGFGYLGKFLVDEPKNQRDMVETNCVAPLHLAQLFLPQMRASKRGGIINIASVAAYPPLAYMATYGATKSFLLNWSLAISQELIADGVRILAVCPGPTESDFHLVAGADEKLDFIPAMSALSVVRQSLKSYSRGERIIVNGIPNVILTGATRFLPKKWLAQLSEVIIRGRAPAERR